MSEKSHVSLEAKVCIVCLTQFETGSIMMDKRLRNIFDKVTVVGLGLCEKCQAQADKGFIAMIEIDPSKSGKPNHNDHVDPNEAFRTGNSAWLRRTLAEQMFPSNLMPEADQPVVFVEFGLIQMLEAKSHGPLN